MYNYPLVFEMSSDGFIGGMRVKDADKQTVLHGSKMLESVLEGIQSYQVVNDPEQRLPVCQIQRCEEDDEPIFVVSDSAGERLGTVVDKGRGRWSILDANGVTIGQIRERNRWRHSFLFGLASSSAMESVAALVFRIRYEVEFNGLRVLQLREMDSEPWKPQAYRLKQFATLAGADELLLLAGLWAALWSVSS